MSSRRGQASKAQELMPVLYDFQNITITAGCNMAAQVVLQILARAGDEVMYVYACAWPHFCRSRPL